LVDGGARRFLPKGASPGAITNAIKDVYAATRSGVEPKRIGSAEGHL